MVFPWDLRYCSDDITYNIIVSLVGGDMRSKTSLFKITCLFLTAFFFFSY